MKIVIQCAATKNPMQPGSGFRTIDNRLIQFVAHPQQAPANEKYRYAHPDGLSDNSMTWRERLIEYNKTEPTNPLRLTPAYQLYEKRIYGDLVRKFGSKQVFILSAGWGLISADFLIPHYDITFSAAKNVEPECRRIKRDSYADMCHLPDDGDDIIFLGGKDYLPLFSQLTAQLKGKKKVFFNAEIAPVLVPGFRSERFVTTQRTNWHYSCAQALIDNAIRI